MQGKDSTARGLKGRWHWQSKTRPKEIRGEASATSQLVCCIAHETEHDSSSAVSTSSLWHDAMTLYIRQLPGEDQQSILSTKDDSALTTRSVETLIAPLIAKHKHGVVMKLLLKFGSTLQHIRSFATVVDVVVQSHPNVACLIWGAVRLILEISSRTLEAFEDISDLFEKLSTYLPIFERWADLFPRADYQELSKCLTQTYFEYISVLVRMIRFLRGSGMGNMIRTAFSPSFQHQFKESEARIKIITKSLVLQVHTAGMDSSMRRDREIANLLRGIADHVSDHHTVKTPVRFLQVMPRNDRYYERGSVMDQMSTLLACQGSRLSSIALHGPMGYAVMCFDTGDRLNFERQVVQLARYLGFAAQGEDASTMRRFVMNWLSTTGDLKWLIVFDNADDRDTLRAFWPAATHGAVIVTSRDPLVQDEGLATYAIQIEGFNMNDGAGFLLSFLERPASSAAEDRAAADTITEHFSGWPIGLRNAATYLRSKRLTPTRFVKLLDLQKNGHQQCSVLESSKMLWDLVLNGIPDDARALLDFLSLLNPRDIPVDFVDTPTFQFLDAREWLSSRSLIGYDDSGSFISMDGYFQDTLFEKLMKIPGRYHAALGRVINSFLEAIPEPDFERPRDPGLWKLREVYIFHVRCLEQRSRAQLASSHVCPLLNLIIRCIHYFFEIGEYQRGFDHVATAESMIQQYDVTDPSVLSILYYVHGRLATETSQLHLSVRLFERALRYFRQIFAMKEYLLLKSDNMYLSRLHSCLGNALTAVNRFSEAEICHHAALEVAPKIDGPQSSTRIGGLYANLGSCLLWQGKYSQAEDLLRESLLRHDRGLECSLYALGNVYLRQGQLKRALEMHRKVLESFSTSLGHNHHTVADSCHKVGSIYALGDFEGRDLHQAGRFLRKALKIYRLMQGNGKSYMDSFIARTEWKLAKITQVGHISLDADAALMEMRSLAYLEKVADSNSGLPQHDDQIEQAFDNLVFFWSR